MKSFLIFAFLLVISAPLWGQVPAKNFELPSVKLKDLDGKTVNSNTFSNKGKPIIISFWATWCKPCLQELVTIHEQYADWQAETGVKLIAISIDDVRNSSKVAPFVRGKGWEYEVYLDENNDFKRALNVNMVPHTFLLDGNQKVVWQHASYVPGDEVKLYEKVKELIGSK
ncbi:MAG: TlpA family protein disulfide reductase [Bacteroidia bacterium]|nr:TlpA family protein disulfide reductase [Bacteroidia bacterium]